MFSWTGGSGTPAAWVAAAVLFWGCVSFARVCLGLLGLSPVGEPLSQISNVLGVRFSIFPRRRPRDDISSVRYEQAQDLECALVDLHVATTVLRICVYAVVPFLLIQADKDS